jgi:lipopolysaccharide/colanic/teichoic acid biosynthesis glycosyltransferase
MTTFARLDGEGKVVEVFKDATMEDHPEGAVTLSDEDPRLANIGKAIRRAMDKEPEAPARDKTPESDHGRDNKHK